MNASIRILDHGFHGIYGGQPTIRVTLKQDVLPMPVAQCMRQLVFAAVSGELLATLAGNC
jgi:hypothetical protein